MLNSEDGETRAERRTHFFSRMNVDEYGSEGKIGIEAKSRFRSNTLRINELCSGQKV
jgi:hypothetical protein